MAHPVGPDLIIIQKDTDMRTIRLVTLSACILLTASGAYANGPGGYGSFGDFGRHRPTGDEGGGIGGRSAGCGVDSGFNRRCRPPIGRPGPAPGGTRTCYNIIGKPYQTRLPTCPIS